MFGPITEQINHERNGKDNTGLGRWTVMMLQGDGVRTRVVCRYNPCNNAKLNSGTTYQQHHRYFITNKKDLSCPRKRFREDLVKQLEEWRNMGDRLIVCLDTNKDIYKKSIGKALTNKDGLHLSEEVGDFTGKRFGATFFLRIQTHRWSMGDAGHSYHTLLHHVSRLWCRQPPNVCDRYARRDSPWDSTLQNQEVHILQAQHKSFQRHNKKYL
jgi:hypothetical protein